jgi:hypothetical protein
MPTTYKPTSVSSSAEHSNRSIFTRSKHNSARFIAQKLARLVRERKPAREKCANENPLFLLHICADAVAQRLETRTEERLNNINSSAQECFGCAAVGENQIHWLGERNAATTCQPHFSFLSFVLRHSLKSMETF